jgi:hypothetical protein
MIKKDRVTRNTSHHVKRDDQQVIREQRQCSREISRPEIEYSINK